MEGKKPRITYIPLFLVGPLFRTRLRMTYRLLSLSLTWIRTIISFPPPSLFSFGGCVRRRRRRRRRRSRLFKEKERKEENKKEDFPTWRYPRLLLLPFSDLLFTVYNRPQRKNLCRRTLRILLAIEIGAETLISRKKMADIYDISLGSEVKVSPA